MTLKDKKSLRKASRSGFTIVEVVVASSILLISVLAVTNAFSYSRRTVSLTENRLACLHIAREVMETLRTENYNSSILTLTPEGTKKRPIPKYPFEDGTYYPSARGYYTVTLSTGGEGGDAKDITVVIEWQEPIGSKIHSVSLTTSHSRGLHR